MKSEKRVSWAEIEARLPECAHVPGKWNFKQPQPDCPFCGKKWTASVDVQKRWFYCGACGTYAIYTQKRINTRGYRGPREPYPPGPLQMFEPQIEYVVRYYRPKNVTEEEARAECISRVLIFAGDKDSKNRRGYADYGVLDGWPKQSHGDINRTAGLVYQRLRDRLRDLSRRNHNEVKATLVADMDRPQDLEEKDHGLARAIGDYSGKQNQYSIASGIYEDNMARLRQMKFDRCYRALPILTLKRMLGWTDEKIAKHLGMSEKAVRACEQREWARVEHATEQRGYGVTKVTA